MLRLWVRARWSWTALALLTVGLVSAVLISSAAMPIMRVGLGTAPFSVVLPALPAIGVLVLTASPLPLEEARAVRTGTYLTRALWAVGLLGICGLFLWCGGQMTGDVRVLESARNLCGYYGLAALISVVGGRLLAYAVPAGYAVAVSILGTRGRGIRVWPLDASGDGTSWAVALGLGALGVVVSSHRWALLRQAQQGMLDEPQ